MRLLRTKILLLDIDRLDGLCSVFVIFVRYFLFCRPICTFGFVTNIMAQHNE